MNGAGEFVVWQISVRAVRGYHHADQSVLGTKLATIEQPLGIGSFDTAHSKRQSHAGRVLQINGINRLIGESADPLRERRKRSERCQQGADTMGGYRHYDLGEIPGTGAEREFVAVAFDSVDGGSHFDAATMRPQVSRRAFWKQYGKIHSRQQQITVAATAIETVAQYIQKNLR